VLVAAGLFDIQKAHFDHHLSVAHNQTARCTVPSNEHATVERHARRRLIHSERSSEITVVPAQQGLTSQAAGGLRRALANGSARTPKREQFKKIQWPHLRQQQVVSSRHSLVVSHATGLGAGGAGLGVAWVCWANTKHPYTETSAVHKPNRHSAQMCNHLRQQQVVSGGHSLVVSHATGLGAGGGVGGLGGPGLGPGPGGGVGGLGPFFRG
jgi:hypothetical protein